MPFLSNTPMLAIAPLVSVLLLSGCATNDISRMYDTPICPSAPTTINQNMADKYGHKDVWRKVMAANRYVQQDKLQPALSVISEGLALPNINAYGRSALYRSKGQAYFNAGNGAEGIKAFEAAIAQGGLGTSEAGYMAELIANAKAHGSITAGDVDAQPLVRVPPIMPPTLDASGHCRMKFDINNKGVPVNVKTTYCTNPILKKATIRAVEQWKYAPKIVDGKAVARKSVLSKIVFALVDECGVLIPEPK